MLKEDKLYLEEFGDIPLTEEDRIKYILGRRQNNPKLLNAIEKSIKSFKKIKWIPFSFIMWKQPIPAARPRVNNSMGYPQIYVPKARQEANWFKAFTERHKVPCINTPCEIDIKIFIKTPTAFNTLKKILAEMRLIRPWAHADWDNYAKTVCDQTQHGMLANDNLIIGGALEKYFSIKPRIEVSGRYMDRMPE